MASKNENTGVSHKKFKQIKDLKGLLRTKNSAFTAVLILNALILLNS